MNTSLPRRSMLTVLFALLVGVDYATAQPTLDPAHIELNWPTVSVSTRVFCGTTPASQLIESNFELYERGKRINQFTMRCTDQSSEARCMSVALVADRSGSMSWDSPSGIEILKSGFKKFIDRMKPECDEATLLSFNHLVTVDVFMTRDKALLTAGIDGLIANGNTALWDGALTGLQELINKGTQTCRAVIVMSDGSDGSSGNTPDDVISIALANNIRVFTIAYGAAADEINLKRIAKETSGLFYKITTSTASQITSVMNQISDAIQRNLGACVFEYTTTCKDGAIHSVELIVKDIPNCPGRDTTGRWFVAPRDASTFTPIGIMIGSAPAEFGQTVHVPLLLGTAIHDVFDEATFTIAVDTQKAKLRKIETQGFLLDSRSIQVVPSSNGYRIIIRNPKPIDGSGILALCIFEPVATTPPWTKCPLELTDWTFTSGCLKPVLTSGELLISPSVILERPAGGETYCAGDDVTIKWYSNIFSKIFLDISSDGGQTFAPLKNDTSKTFTWRIPASMPAGSYTFRIRDGNSQYADTMHVPFIVVTRPAILKQPADVTTCAGQSVTFDSKSNSNQPYIIWQQSIDDGATWQSISGAPSNDTISLRSVKPADNGLLIRAMHYNQCNLGTPSNPARLTVLTPPTFAIQPKDTSVCEGYSATFLIQPRAGSQSAVRWQISTNAGASFTDIAGAIFWDFSIPQVTTPLNGNRYRAILTNACGQDTSRVVTLTITQSSTITSQPKTRIACEGDSVKLTVSASPVIGYQWFKDGVALPGRTNPLLDLGRVSMADAGKYFARITGNCGLLDSDTAIVSVNTTTKISGHPTSQTVKEKTSVTFSVVAAGTNLRYQWMRNGVPIPNATNSTLTISSVVKADEGVYTVFIQGDCGDIISNAAQLGVTIVSVGKEPSVPRVATLHQNVPNPFASTSEIGFTIHEKTHVSITVHDLLGRTIETLVDRSYTAGSYSVRVDARLYKPGMYVYTLKTPTQTEHRRMVIVK